MKKKLIFLTLMILVCFTINSVCAQSLENLNCNDGFDDCDLVKDSSAKTLKSSGLSSANKLAATNKTTTVAKSAATTVKTTTKATNTTKASTTVKTATKTTTNAKTSAKVNKTTVNTKTLAKGSSSFMTYVNKNGKLQDPITISNKKYKASEYLYLISKAVSNISNEKIEIKDKTVTNYSNTNCKSINGTINKTEYVQLASKTYKFIEKNKRAPNWVSSSKGKIPRNQLILALSKCLDYYNKNNKLPSSIKLNDLDLNKIKQKIDSSKKAINSTKKANATKTNVSAKTTKSSNTTIKKTNTTAKKTTTSTKTNTTKTSSTKTNTKTNKTLVETTLDSIKSILNNIANKLNPVKNILSISKSNEKSIALNTSKLNVKVSGKTSVNVKVSAKDTKTSTSTKKTNTTTTKKTNTSSSKASTSTKKTNTSTSTKSSLTAKYLNTSILNDKYLGESLKKYLSASKNCQVSNTLIKSLAKKLTSTLKTDFKKGEKIFNWVRDNVGYSKYRNTKKGALQTLKSKSANCVDQAHLVVALSRAAGLPARYVNGNNCKFTSGYVSGHVWAQVLVGNTWVVADTTSSRNKFGVVNNWNVKNYQLVGKYSSISF